MIGDSRTLIRHPLSPTGASRTLGKGAWFSNGDLRFRERASPFQRGVSRIGRGAPRFGRGLPRTLVGRPSLLEVRSWLSAAESSDDATRISCCEDVVANVAGHHAACADDGAGFDGHSRQHDRAAADPDVEADLEGLAGLPRATLDVPALGILRIVGCAREHRLSFRRGESPCVLPWYVIERGLRELGSHRHRRALTRFSERTAPGTWAERSSIALRRGVSASKTGTARS